MSREIKFRAFHLPTKVMYWFDVMNGNHSQGQGYIGMALFGEEITKNIHRDNLRLIDPTDCEIMQFTGLADKNGKEIYEGDILSGYLGLGKSEISFKNGSFMWNGELLGYDYTENGLTFSNTKQWADVLGNIHENPELLNNAQ